MISEGIVINTNDNTAKIKVIRKSACGENCASCGGCEKNSITVKAVNKANAKPGDRVILESNSVAVLLTAFVVYIVPLLSFVAGYFMFEKAGEGIAAAISVVFFVCTFLIIKFFYKTAPEVRIVRIIKESSEETNVEKCN